MSTVETLFSSSASNEATFPSYLSYLLISPRLHLLGIPETRAPPPPKRLSISPHTPRIHIPRGPRMARSPIMRIGRRRRGSSVVEMLSKVEMALPPSPVSTRLAPPVELVLVARILPRSLATIVMRRDTTRETISNSSKTPQKTSDSLDNLHVGN